MGAVRPPADVAVGAAARREAEGFDAVWWADHLLHWFPLGIWDPELVPQAAVQASPHVWLDPVPVIAQAAVATDRIRLGIGVTDLVRRNPASLAQTALTLDHLTGVRAIVSAGAEHVQLTNMTPLCDPSRAAPSDVLLGDAVTTIRAGVST